ncbi:DUF975 family protein [bacterium D16-50]|nr:DUF975 family protein [bacterium D16-50]
MRTRKEMKADAGKVLKRHYGLFLLLCMVASLLGGEIALTGNIWKDGVGQGGAFAPVSFSQGMVVNLVDFTADIARGEQKRREQEIHEAEERYVEESERNKDAILGRSRGVFALVVNKLTSGAYFMTLLMGIRSLVGTDSGAIVVMLLGAMLLLLFVEIFLTGVYKTVVLRMFLEGRCYEKVSVQRAWFLLRVKKWCHVGVVQLVTNLFAFLWGLTIAGGIIKHYSYYLVPCILAENPAVGTMEAITLSRKMMKGHKWECFVLELSFLGWELLGILTIGLSDIFFTAPYKVAVMGEYYAELRRLCQEKGLDNGKLLNDRYLFEQAGAETLEQAYGDVEEECGKFPQEDLQLNGIHKFLAEVFGLSVRQSKNLEEVEARRSRGFELEADREALEGTVYPTRLYPIPEKRKRKWVVSLNYLRYYSVWSLLMMFFMLSFMGWVWEVSLHLITDGVLVNRGVMHGPWLPIYGCGSVLILLFLNRFRRNPALEFILIVVLCGSVEYFTSLVLEIVHGGTRWWDYTGYFLNLHGRICAEGLLVFGIGGMAIVYVLAPFLDGMFRRLPVKALMAAGLILTGIFAADQIYSSIHPNEGEGITSYEAFPASREVEPW